nr:hypothetical protein [Gammaproteobacteria bacterium]
MLKKFFSLSPGNNSEDLEKSPSEKIEEELQQVLFQIRFEEKKYRLKCQIDEWDRKPLYAKKFWRRNPFQVELDNLIKSGNPDTSTSDDDSNFMSIHTVCHSRLEQAKSTKLEVIQARKEKREELEALEKNLGLDNISQVIQSEERPKRKNYWERLYLCAKYPGLFRKPTSSAQTNTSTTNQTPQRVGVKPTHRVKVSPRKSLQDSIRINIQGIYNITDQSDSLLSDIKKKIPSYWNIVPSWLSSEQKTVKLLLEAADKRDLNEQEMIA